MNTTTIEHDQIHDNMRNRGTWLRLLFMLLYVAVLHLAGVVMWVVCVMQFLIVVFHGEKNSNLLQLGATLSEYIAQILRFVSFNTEEKPFPFAPWPSAKEQ
ncbi:protein of unknown function [Alteromonadaceae bacterium Bs31]|nr:protein of unknown function [Alteromonadaceae bacterium Bs31]